MADPVDYRYPFFKRDSNITEDQRNKKILTCECDGPKGTQYKFGVYNGFYLEVDSNFLVIVNAFVKRFGLK